MTMTQQPGRRHCLLQLLALLVMVESGIAADEKIEELQIVKRYLALLVEINTPDSIKLLKEFAGHDPSRIQKLAVEALQQLPSKD